MTNKSSGEVRSTGGTPCVGRAGRHLPSHLLTDGRQADMFGSPMRSQYENFRRENPHVEIELVNLARQLIRRGHCRYSMKALFEIVRWHRALETTDADFKLNNNYTAFYARDLMDEYSDLDGFFSLRKQHYEEY